MKIKYIDNSSLFESLILEDKQVKFGGEVNPKYGWCVIYAGGSASGKSTATGFNVPIVGKKLDVDEFKSLDIKNERTGNIEPGFVKKFEGGKYYNAILNDSRIGGDESKMAMNDPDYPGVAHEILDPFLDKVKAQQIETGKHNSSDRLPNIIFDQTSKNPSKLAKLVYDVKQYGYKVAIIYILTDMRKNLEMYYKRGKTGRKLPMDLFLDIHPKVIDTMFSVFNNPELLNTIDDFWVIVNEYKKAKTDKQKLAQINDTNVYHVPLEPDGLQQVHFITKSGKQKKETLYDMMMENKEYLNFLSGNQ